MESKDTEMDFFIAISIAREYFPNIKSQQHNYYYVEYKDSEGDVITYTLLVKKKEPFNHTELLMEQKGKNWWFVEKVTEAEWRESLTICQQRILSDNPFAFEDMDVKEECKW